MADAPTDHVSPDQSSDAPAALPPPGMEEAASGVRTTADMLELQHAIIENLPGAGFVTDEDGRIVLVNQRARLLFGYTRDQMVGQPVEMLVPERLREQHVMHRADYNAKPRIRPAAANLTLIARQKSGREIPVEIMLIPIVTGAGAYTIVTVRRRKDAAPAG